MFTRQKNIQVLIKVNMTVKKKKTILQIVKLRKKYINKTTGMRNEEDSSNEFENQIDVENNDNQEKDTPVSSVENVENQQENVLNMQLHDQNVNLQFMLKK